MPARKKATTPEPVAAMVAAPAPVAADAATELKASLRAVETTLNGVNLRRYRGETRDRVRSLRDETKSLLASL